jgi:hypothetical protein
VGVGAVLFFGLDQCVLVFNSPYGGPSIEEAEMLFNLWADESGAVLSFELLLLLVLTVIGASVGMTVLRDAIVAEFQRVAASVNALDAGYMISDLEYTGNTTSASVNGTDASNAALGIGPGTGLITNNVVASGNIFATPDEFLANNTVVVSP